MASTITNSLDKALQMLNFKNTMALSDFKLYETLGTGTFGRVRLCKHRTTGKFYAIKILNKSSVIELKQVAHVKSEKSVLEEVSHGCIVNLISSFQDTDRLYMVFEYVPGGELFSHLRKIGKFPNDVAKYYAAELVLALAHLHTQNIVYRDLKPENLMLDKHGHIKITDFGFAKRVTERTYTLCGTPEYLAPEIIQCNGHNKGVDWWALGILIFEMLVGYPPFIAGTPLKLYRKILHNKLEVPNFLRSSASDIIVSLLEKNPSKRLGNLRGGTEDVMNHRWFRGVDWKLLAKGKIGSPITIKLAGPDDSSYFEKYPEDEDKPRKITEEQQKLFADF